MNERAVDERTNEQAVGSDEQTNERSDERTDKHPRGQMNKRAVGKANELQQTDEPNKKTNKDWQMNDRMDG